MTDEKNFGASANEKDRVPINNIIASIILVFVRRVAPHFYRLLDPSINSNNNIMVELELVSSSSRRPVALLVFLAAACTTCTTTDAFSSSSSKNCRTTRSRHQMAFDLMTEGLSYNDMLSDYPLVTSSFTSGCLSGLGDAIAQLKEGRKPPQKAEEDMVVPLAAPKQTRQALIPKLSFDEATNNFDSSRNRRFIIKGFGGGLIWLFWFRLADDITQSLLMPLMNLGNNEEELLSSTVTTTTNMMTSSGGLHLPQVTSILIGTTLFSILLDQFLASPVVFALWDIPVPILLSKTMEQQPQQESASLEATSIVVKEDVNIPHHVQTKLGGLLVANAKVWTFANAIIYNLPLEYRVVASSMTDLVWQSIVSSHVNDDTTTAATATSTSSARE